MPAITKYVENANTSKNQASARTIYTNAVLAHSIDPDMENTELITKVKDLSNVKAVDEVTVTLHETTKEVTEISYTTGGKKITFNGKEFDPAE